MKQMDIEKIEKEDQGPILEPEETKEEPKKEKEEVEKKEISFDPPKPPVSPTPPKKPERGSFLPYFLGLLIGLIAVFGFIEVRAYLAKRSIEEIQPQENTQTETQTPENTTSQTETPAQTTAPAEQTQTATPALDKSAISMQVLNGSGVTGEATKIKSVLEKDGFKVASVGNASSFTYQTTIVYYKTGKKDAADAAVSTLKNAGRTASAEEKTALTKYDLQVVVGKK